jgi:hypothetical protein
MSDPHGTLRCKWQVSAVVRRLVDLCGLMGNELPVAVLLDPDVEKIGVHIEIVTGCRHLDANMAGDYGGFSIETRVAVLEFDGVVVQIAAAHVGDELRFALGFAAGMGIGEVVGQDLIEGGNIGVYSGIRPFLVESFGLVGCFGVGSGQKH